LKSIFLIAVLAVSLLACSESPAPVPAEAAPDAAQDAPYEVISDDLQSLKDAFNANEGRVRLLFLSGPTCGICLRGMADLNDEFLAERQNDDRLVSFVVHVPTMGAKERHVIETIPLLQGPRIHHYWEDSGIIGQHFSDTMDVAFYVWDFWAIYGPDARWDGTLPPKPLYYEHQLGGSGGFPQELLLDAKRFAQKTMAALASVDASRFTNQAMSSQNQSGRNADGTEISVVGQPRNVAVALHIRGRGGYANLKRVQSVVSTGRIETDFQAFELTVSRSRPNIIQRDLLLIDASSTDEAGKTSSAVAAAQNRRLLGSLETTLLDTFEFDGLFVEWPAKGHAVEMLGMRKIGDILTWKLALQQNGGPDWYMYVDSHSGDLVRMEMFDEGDIALAIVQSDFRASSGIRFPHRIEYRAADGAVIATEITDSIILEVDLFEIDDANVSH